MKLKQKILTGIAFSAMTFSTAIFSATCPSLEVVNEIGNQDAISTPLILVKNVGIMKVQVMISNVVVSFKRFQVVQWESANINSPDAPSGSLTCTYAGFVGEGFNRPAVIRLTTLPAGINWQPVPKGSPIWGGNFCVPGTPGSCFCSESRGGTIGACQFTALI